MKRGCPSTFPLTREELQALADDGLTMREVANQLGVTRAAVAGIAKRRMVRFSKFHSKNGKRYNPRTPEGEARRVAGVKAMWADPERKAAWQASVRRNRMARSMADPDYVYTPHSEDRKAKIRAAQLQRLGTPEGYHQVYGVHVPDQYAKQAMDAGRKVYQRIGRAAAERFVAELLKSLSEN